MDWLLTVPLLLIEILLVMMKLSPEVYAGRKARNFGVDNRAHDRFGLLRRYVDPYWRRTHSLLDLLVFLHVLLSVHRLPASLVV